MIGIAYSKADLKFVASASLRTGLLCGLGVGFLIGIVVAYWLA